jgi:hypothetical protein
MVMKTSCKECFTIPQAPEEHKTAKDKQGEDTVFIYQSRFPGDGSAGLGR